MNTLYGISYSPWSEKARWALAAAKVPFKEVAYLPMLGEPLLRARLWRSTPKGSPAKSQSSGRVSVPVLFTADGPIPDSLEIARWAAAHSPAAVDLFPVALAAEIERWNRVSEGMLDAGRARTTALVAADPVAMLENLPPPLRKLGPISRALGQTAVGFLKKKYSFGAESEAALTARIRKGMAELAAALDGGRTYLLGDRFTHADIAMAVALQVVRPPAHIRVGRRSLEHWTNAALAAEFPALLQWRDLLLERHH